MRPDAVSLGFVLLFFSLSALSQTQSTPQTATNPSTATVTGQNIGTIVKVAIDTALPGLQALMNLIWPGGNPNDRKTKAEVSTQIGQTQQTLLKQVQAKLQALSQEAAEIKVIQTFMKSSIRAHENVTTMQVLLAVGAHDAALLKKLSNEWDIAKAKLSPLAQVTDAQLSAVRESSVRAHLADVRDAKDDVMRRLDMALMQSDFTLIDRQLAVMSQLLSGIDSIAYAQLSDIEQEVSYLVSFANAGQGLGPLIVQVDGEAMAIAQRSIASAKKQ
jgi:hypothetical protein